MDIYRALKKVVGNVVYTIYIDICMYNLKNKITMGKVLIGRRDSISSLLSSIQTSSEKKKMFVDVLQTTEILNILKCLENSGFIRGFKVSKKKFSFCRVYLKYSGGKPIIRRLKRVSRSSKRVYVNSTYIKNLLPTNYHYVLSTSKGYLCTLDQNDFQLGGELIFKING